MAAAMATSLAIGIAIGASLQSAIAAAPASDPAPTPAPSTHSRYQKLDMFARALSIIEQHYVRPVDGDQLMYAAIRGLVSELDPHSSFLVPAEARLLREDIEGVFGGVGMVVVLGRDPDGTRYLDVRDVIADSPADDADIVTGSRVTRVDGKSIAQFPDLQRAITTIRGEPGTTIRVTVEDRTTGISRTVALVREVIDPPAVEVRVLGEGIATLRLREFSEDAAREVRDAIATLRRQAADKPKGPGVRGIVLDLRDNGGGLLDEAIEIVDLFVDDGIIVRTRGRRGTVIDEARARRPGTEADLPLVVLVNKASASASEIVAGALQDHGRALIIGERTYGKGSVQAPFELEDGSLLKLTTSLYYTPDDRLIQASGITPDVHVGVPTGLPATAQPVPLGDSRPEIMPEREVPRHLEPEDFGRLTPSKVDESPAVRAAGDDLQLRTAVQHLVAWDRVRPQRRRR